MKINVSISTDSYNSRRFGKPWLAQVEFVSAGKQIFNYGEWCGERGEEGLLEITADSKAIFAHGQKDNHNSRNNAANYFVYIGHKDEIKLPPPRNSFTDDNGNVFEKCDKKTAYIISKGAKK